MKGKMTVSHAKFQYYRHNYCLVCMTGLLGCRWHRYQQSTRDNRKRDMFWFTLFTLGFLFLTFYFYFWLMAENDYNLFEWYMFNSLKTWIPWYKVILPLCCAAFGYVVLVMLLYLCHLGHGHQIFIHPIHVVLIALSLLACIATTIALDHLWNSQFTVLYISLQMMGPFLHIGAVTLATCLMWLVSHSWYKLSRKLYQCLWLLVIMGVMVGLYICPLYIHCPCISRSPSVPPKPKLFAHRGAEHIAPENTEIAFQKAIEYGAFGLESDVRISYDGVPFLFHDDTFQRTTNIEDVFPDRKEEDVSMFNISDISILNAGSWYMQNDPYSKAGSVSDEDQVRFDNQRIMLLRDLLRLATQHNKIVMFDIRDPVEANPFHGLVNEIIYQLLANTSFSMNQLYWIELDAEHPTSPPGAHRIYPGAPPTDRLREVNISKINAHYDGLDQDRIRAYRSDNISSSVYVVDVAWMLSYYWCLGTTTVTTRRIDQLVSLEDPVWTMASNSYLIMWVAVDVISAVIIIIIFVVQRIRLFGTSFSPESISLTSARRARTYRSRTMKEKLLRDGVIDPIEDSEGAGAPGVINHPAAYSMSSLPPSSPPPPPPGSFSHVASSGIRRVGPLTPSSPDQKYEVE